MLTCVLLWMDRREHYAGKLTVWYLILYSVGRFLVEYLRADYRGSVGPLSASQFIGLFVIAGAMFLRSWLKKGRSYENK